MRIASRFIAEAKTHQLVHMPPADLNINAKSFATDFHLHAPTLFQERVFSRPMSSTIPVVLVQVSAR
jgi:hypothetical protein